jgi:uncharacterized protein YegP (UPF0339 family)
MPDQMTSTGGGWTEDESNGDKYFEVYQDQGGEWRWTKWSKRGNLPDEITSDSAEGYSSLAEASKAAWKDDKKLRVVVRKQGAIKPRGDS